MIPVCANSDFALLFSRFGWLFPVPIMFICTIFVFRVNVFLASYFSSSAPLSIKNQSGEREEYNPSFAVDNSTMLLTIG